jgi:hypothetical protein
MHGGKILDTVEIDLRSNDQQILKIYFDVFDNSLSRKWLREANHLLSNDYHLEKNYCFFGFPDGPRNGVFILDQINQSIQVINESGLGYHIQDRFTIENSLVPGEMEPTPNVAGIRADIVPGEVDRAHFNQLHRYFEDLQGTSGAMSEYYQRASAEIKWHIRQLNLLCHEFESWALSNRKKHTAPEWMRPSQLMCWLNAPRFDLDKEDHDLFGVETMNRPLGGVYVGVNKAIGKHHWEVFVDEADYDPDMIIDDLVTTTLRGQLEASGDFDIEWANNPGDFAWQKKHLADFKIWLRNNGFDPDDKSLTIGHPQIGQVDLEKSFGTTHYRDIWKMLSQHLDVHRVKTSDAQGVYNYTWKDHDFVNLQIDRIFKGT